MNDIVPVVIIVAVTVTTLRGDDHCDRHGL
jgi:hypothetical protein